VRRPVTSVARAALVAGTVSGLPSTAHALACGRSPLAATRAAGQLLGRPGVVRGGLAHVALTAWWTWVLQALLPRRHEVAWGAVAGAGIAVLDLGVARRRWPAIAGLPTGPQVADHVAFGALVGGLLAHDRRAGASDGS
jgi:hypothetical protein